MLMRALLVLALSTPLAAQATWTVDDDGPADFASIQAAIDAAADGDTILVRPGGYTRAVIDGKGLVIQADGGPVVLLMIFAFVPTLEIRNLAAHQAVHVRGLELDAISAEVTTLVVANCAGPVLVEDCFINGAGQAVSVQGSASATFSRCELVPPPTFASLTPFFFLGFVPYMGLAATSSNVFLYDCLVEGSSGADAHFEVFFVIPPATSAPGLRLSASTLFASGSTIRGGNGGGDPAGHCYPGAGGSTGLLVENGAVAHLLDCTVLGGTGGVGGCGNPPGADGQAIQVVSGDVQHLPGTARAFHGTSPIVEGTATNVHLAGEPGDAVLLHVQLAAAPGLFLQDFGVVLHLPLPFAVVGLGAIPPSGVLDLAFPVPVLPPGVESFRAVGQALFVGAGGFFEGGPSTLLILDAAL